ncbi:ATP-dependent protease LonB [Candidatus Woesearchaeota archaeon]|nr:ATP-dependent protease LonB [Candidatus Woesearchaeota archaeon]
MARAGKSRKGKKGKAVHVKETAAVSHAAEFNFKTTKELKVSQVLIDQIIGQEDAVHVIKKAAKQRRHVLLIGEPGTGKSMMGMAMAELLPKEKLVDVVVFANPNDENQHLVRVVPAGKGRDIANSVRLETGKLFKQQNIVLVMLLIASLIMPWWAFNHYSAINPVLGGVMFMAFSLFGVASLVSYVLFLNLGKRMGIRLTSPKVIVDNFNKKTASFYDATGAHAGALLGDVLHDPFQSGGLGTPAHERVVAGMIHKANMGVLFIDEIAILEPATQQELLTALQEGRYPITGQSERSAGAMVRTEAVPCNFILVAAGNVETVARMHPALRSRIRGYGYEVYMRNTMEDTPENRAKIAKFVAQEVSKDKKIPHFTPEAVAEIITEAKRRANRKGHLSLLLRDLGGIVRAAGDLAIERGAAAVERQHVLDAKKIARSLEQQIADKIIEQKKEYEVIVTEGRRVGRVNGLAVMGGGATFSGIILPIEAEVVPGGEAREIIATGKLGAIAKEAIKNVSAIIKKFFGEDIKKKHDIYVQFLQTYEGVEGDSASIAVATAIISALKNIPVKQEYAMTGSLSVRGEVLPVGGVSAKVEAAVETGIRKVIVPKSNVKDIILDKASAAKVDVIPVETIIEVLKEALDWKGKETILKKIVAA